MQPANKGKFSFDSEYHSGAKFTTFRFDLKEDAVEFCKDLHGVKGVISLSSVTSVKGPNFEQHIVVLEEEIGANLFSYTDIH